VGRERTKLQQLAAVLYLVLQACDPEVVQRSQAQPGSTGGYKVRHSHVSTECIRSRVEVLLVILTVGFFQFCLSAYIRQLTPGIPLRKMFWEGL
jgi:hypothetical protein